MKLEIDWTKSDPAVREAIDNQFSISPLMTHADYAACGRFGIEEESPREIAERLEELSQVFADTADKIKDFSNKPGDTK